MRVLKYLGLGLLVVVLGVGGFVGYIAATDMPRYEPGKLEITVAVTPERVARGKQLTSLLCAGCHADTTTGKLTGHHMSDAPPEFGPIYSRNITKHPTKGIGGWTDGELIYLLRTGIARDGSYIPPYMVKLPFMADEDIMSIVAFLRSDDAMVAPVDADPPGVTQPSLLTKVLTRVAFKPLPYPAAPVAMPDPNDEVAHGRYLAVAALDCYPCHSADFKSMNPLEPEKTPGFFGGGNPVLGANGQVVFSANLTADDETGIGSWSREDFVRALRTGFRPDKRALHYPMLPAPELTEAEAGAIYAFLRSLPKIENPLTRPSAAPVVTTSGQELYTRYGCVACHGQNGIGIADLRQAHAKYPSDAELIDWIKNASTKKPGTKMPSWNGIIAEEHYGPLVQYVRELGGAKP